MATVAQKRVDMALISCNAMVRTGEVIALSQILVFACGYCNERHFEDFLNISIVFSALRVYAVWDQNIALSLLVMMLNVVPFITNMVSVYRFRRILYIHSQYCKYGDSSVVLSYVDDPILGKSCLLSNRVSPEDNFRCACLLSLYPTF